MADNVKSFRSSEPNRTSPERRSHFRVEAVVSVRTRRPRAAANEIPTDGGIDPITAFEDLASTATRYRKELSGSGRLFLDRLMITMDALVGELSQRRIEGAWGRRTLVEASLSAGGIGYAAEAAIAVGTEVEIEFSVLSQGSSVPFRVVSEVRRCLALPEGGFDIGLQFIEMGHNTRERLVRLVFDLQRLDLRQRSGQR